MDTALILPSLQQQLHHNRFFSSIFLLICASPSFEEGHSSHAWEEILPSLLTLRHDDLVDRL
jgi:hypothetical protein